MLQSELFTSKNQNLVLARLQNSGFLIFFVFKFLFLSTLQTLYDNNILIFLFLIFLFLSTLQTLYFGQI